MSSRMPARRSSLFAARTAACWTNRLTDSPASSAARWTSFFSRSVILAATACRRFSFKGSSRLSRLFSVHVQRNTRAQPAQPLRTTSNPLTNRTIREVVLLAVGRLYGPHLRRQTAVTRPRGSFDVEWNRVALSSRNSSPLAPFERTGRKLAVAMEWTASRPWSRDYPESVTLKSFASIRRDGQRVRRGLENGTT